MWADWPLIGRAEEMSAIDRATRRHAGSRGVVLAGLAGVGKTRLAREALARADARRRPTRWVAATASGRNLPLGAFSLLVGDVGSDPMRVLQRAADALCSVGDAGEPVIIVDDAQALDDVSASLVQQLVAQQRATVILTVRSGAPAPDAIESVWKDGYLDRIEVQPLSLDETAALLAAALGGPVERQTSERLFELSGGNVLFLRHIVAGEVAAGRLAQYGGCWRWLGGLVVSTELLELVGHRLEGLPDTVTDLLDVLALAGPLDQRAAEQLVSRETIEDAETAGVVTVEDQPGRPVVRLAHPLYGQVRQTSVGGLRARRLRGAAAQALAQIPDVSTDAMLRRAVLSLDSDLPDDAELQTAAAQAALQLFDWHLGRRLATAAVEAGGGFDASLALSYALGFGPDPREADRVLESLVESAADDLQLLRASVPRAGHLYYMQGRVDEAKRLMTQVRAELRDPALRPLADGIRAMFAAMSGDAETSLELADEVLAQPAPPPQVRLAAHWARVVTLGALGRTDDLGAADTHCHEIAATSYDSSLPRLGFGDLHVRVHRLTGRIRDATSLASTLVPEVRNTTTTIAPWVESIGAIASLARGQVRSAQSVAARCLDVMRDHETSGWLYTSAITLTNASAMTGDGPAARAAAEEMERERHPGFRVIEPERMLAWAWVEAAEGSTTRAIQQARKTADVAARHGQWGYEAFALATAVRFGDKTVADRLAELATVVAGPRVRAAAVQAEALARSDGAALLEGSGMFEEMGDPLSAADAAAQAAVCFDNQDQRSAHQAACLRARQLQNQCEDASTPAVASALRPLPLTDREREIVALAAAGLSNRQIADRLVVSVRTVEGHLYRAGGKLGVTDRRQLTTVLRDDSRDLRPATRRTTGPAGR